MFIHELFIVSLFFLAKVLAVHLSSTLEKKRENINYARRSTKKNRIYVKDLKIL